MSLTQSWSRPRKGIFFPRGRSGRWLVVGVGVGVICFALAGVGVAAPAVGSTAPGAARLFQWRPFLAPFHAVVLHFPIGFVTMAAILEIYRAWRPSDELKRVTALVLWLSLASGIVAALLGTMRAASGGYEPHLLEWHRVCGMAVPAFTLTTLMLQKRTMRPAASRQWVYCYRGFLAATTALLMVAGHYGGNLTHGARYLTENAPAFVREFLDDESEGVACAEATSAGTNASPGMALFVHTVQPALASKCIRCHGPEKQKGNYRIDQPEIALKGGESGRTAIRPGEPLESHLVRLILLPRDDDSVMPPDGKEPLTAEETMAIIQWIQQGAPFPGSPTASRLAREL